MFMCSVLFLSTDRMQKGFYCFRNPNNSNLEKLESVLRKVGHVHGRVLLATVDLTSFCDASFIEDSLATKHKIFTLKLQ